MYREKSKEREFVANFVARTPNTSGERLANWLQPESFIDPKKCEVRVLNKMKTMEIYARA